MRFLSICLLMSWVMALSAQDQSEQLIQSAEQALSSQDYPKAITALEQLLADGYASADLYYNLGLAYYQQANLGATRQAWEQGLRLRPHHADLRHNLKVFLRDHPDTIQPLPQFFLRAWWMGLAGLMSPNAWTVLGLIILWSGAALVTVFLLGYWPKRRAILSGASLVLISLLPFLLALSRRTAIQDTSAAVLLQTNAILRAAPQAESTEERTLRAGWKMKVLDQYGDWQKVRLEDGTEGWLPSTAIEKV